ncbi:MAG: phosphoribosylanthranilate isomerase [Blastocatellia bacterium]|nr:phosphoribosylanthranilate isomerase [Blastocatellia bacterium]
MSRVRVKICGVRSLEEARAASDAGADAIGFNFWPESLRYIAPEAAREIISGLPPLIACIGVFVNEERESIIDIASQVGLSAVQLHGDESPDFCARLDSVKIIKAFRVGEGFDVGVIEKYDVSAALLDTRIKGSYGGTGQRFDWSVALEAKKRAPVILAGGLTIENVADAIRQVSPMAIDVCSGVEASPGSKDLDKLRRFMNEVARANQEYTARGVK